MKKRILCIILAIAMLACMIPASMVTVFANDGTYEIGDVWFSKAAFDTKPGDNVLSSGYYRAYLIGYTGTMTRLMYEVVNTDEATFTESYKYASFDFANAENGYYSKYSQYNLDPASANPGSVTIGLDAAYVVIYYSGTPGAAATRAYIIKARLKNDKLYFDNSDDLCKTSPTWLELSHINPANLRDSYYTGTVDMYLTAAPDEPVSTTFEAWFSYDGLCLKIADYLNFNFDIFVYEFQVSRSYYFSNGTHFIIVQWDFVDDIQKVIGIEFVFGYADISETEVTSFDEVEIPEVLQGKSFKVEKCADSSKTADITFGKSLVTFKYDDNTVVLPYNPSRTVDGCLVFRSDFDKTNPGPGECLVYYSGDSVDCVYYQSKTDSSVEFEYPHNVVAANMDYKIVTGEFINYCSEDRDPSSFRAEIREVTATLEYKGSTYSLQIISATPDVVRFYDPENSVNFIMTDFDFDEGKVGYVEFCDSEEEYLYCRNVDDSVEFVDMPRFDIPGELYDTEWTATFDTLGDYDVAIGTETCILSLGQDSVEFNIVPVDSVEGCLYFLTEEIPYFLQISYTDDTVTSVVFGTTGGEMSFESISVSRKVSFNIPEELYDTEWTATIDKIGDCDLAIGTESCILSLGQDSVEFNIVPRESEEGCLYFLAEGYPYFMQISYTDDAVTSVAYGLADGSLTYTSSSVSRKISGDEEEIEAAKSALNSAIGAANEITDSTLYTAKSWAELYLAKVKANTVSENLNDKTPNEINAAANALNDAIENLVKLSKSQYNMINEFCEYDGLMARQGKIIDGEVSDKVGRTIIPLTKDQLDSIEEYIWVVGFDGYKEFRVRIDCAYTWFYNGVDKIEAGVTPGLENYAAFIIIDNDGTDEDDNTISGFGYYRIYNGEIPDDEESAMHDALYLDPKVDMIPKELRNTAWKAQIGVEDYGDYDAVLTIGIDTATLSFDGRNYTFTVAGYDDPYLNFTDGSDDGLTVTIEDNAVTCIEGLLEETSIIVVSAQDSIEKI